MAARRLLIVMLVLLGLHAGRCPGAAAFAARRHHREHQHDSAHHHNRRAAPGRSLSVKIVVGGKKVPVVAAPLCKALKPRCEPLHVGDQLSLEVLSKEQAELEIPTFGLIGVASDNSPALFQLLPQEPGTIGVLFTSPRRVAARVQVLSAKAAAKAIENQRKPKSKSKSRARAGSGSP